MSKNMEKRNQYVEAVARRTFLKRAVVGTVLAAPVIASLTKSDILVKSALAGSAPPRIETFTVLITIDGGDVRFPGMGTVDPAGPEVKVPKGGSREFTIAPDAQSYTRMFAVDGSETWGYGLGPQTITITDNGQPTRTLYVLFRDRREIT